MSNRSFLTESTQGLIEWLVLIVLGVGVLWMVL
jgi:hypothetical protein